MSNASYEKDILQFWQENDIYNLVQTQENAMSNDVFDFMDGPPFPNSKNLHHGHIFIGSLKDTVLRYQRMHGKKCPNKLGFDTHGLPTESACMKRLNLTTNADIEKFGVANFNEECITMINEFTTSWKPIYDRCGRWCDFNNVYKTLDKNFMESIWWSFKELHKKGLIYQGYKVMPYSWKLETPLSNFEAGENYKEVNTNSIYVAFDLVTDSNIKFVAWTTTPWTLPSNLALCVNPNANYMKCTTKSDISYIVGEHYVLNLKMDFISVELFGKGSDLVGLEYVPLFDFLDVKFHKVLADLYVKDQSEIGTGIVHIAPAYGDDDCRVCRLAGIIDNKNLDKLCPINSTGEFLPIIKPYAGMLVFDADKLIVKDLMDSGKGLLTQMYKHNYAFCERSNTPLISRTCSSVFVEVTKLKERMLELNEKISWSRPEIGQNRFKNWLEHTIDWGLSRNRNFGTPIPLWQTADGEETIVIGSIQELVDLAGLEFAPTDLHTQHIDSIVIISPTSGKPMRRIKDVFDCVTENTQISLGNGRNTRITNMYNHLNTNVMSFKNTENFKNITQSTCNAFIEKGSKQCIEITLEDGRTLECTKNHKILTYENNKYIWKQSHELITGVSRIVTSVKYPEILNLNDTTESHWQLSCKNTLLKYNTYDDKIKSMTFARLLGYILTDGSFHNHTTVKKVTGTFLIANILDAQLVANDINLLCGVNPNINYNSRSNLHLINVPKQLLDSFINLEGIQIGRRINKEATLPQFILEDNCPVDIIREFLSGMFGGDGITPRVSPNICKKTKTISYKFIGIKFVASKTETHINSLIAEYNNIVKLFNKIGINNVEISKPYQTSTSKKQLNTEKKYQLLLTISNPKDILLFHKYIGFAYCLQKQMRLEICASWRNVQECLSNKRNDIFQQILTHIDNGFTRQQAYDIISVKHNDLQNIMTFNQVSNCLRANTNVTKCLSNILLKDWLISINALEFFFDDTLKKGKNVYIVKNTDTYIPSFNLLVTNKTSIGIKKVYDLSVELTHAFIANGMVIHNCWFESGCVPTAKLHYPFENSTYFDNKEYLSDFVAEGIDQTRGWFYTLLVLSTALFDKPPFKHCICSGLILDEHGKKFSKKTGNFIDPNLLLDEHGSDILRLYLEKSPLSNAQELYFKSSDVTDVGKKLIPYTNGVTFFIDHLTNAYKSGVTDVKYIGKDFDYNSLTNVTDKWILERVSNLREFVETHMDEYHVDKPVLEILNFIEDLTNWYIKFNRLRMKGKFGETDQQTALSVLYTVLYEYILISAPFMPFLSEHIYKQLKTVFTQQSVLPTHVLSVHMLHFPNVERKFGIEQSFKKLQTLCSLIRGIRDGSTTHTSTKVPIELCVVYEDDQQAIVELQNLLEVIQDEVNCTRFEFQPVPAKSYCLKPNFKVIGKKYKKLAQNVANILLSISSIGVSKYLEHGGGVLGIINNDNIYEFLPDEFEIIETKLMSTDNYPNIVIKESNGLLLAVDLNISEEGAEKYLVKCFCKEVQNIRKQMGLKQWDKIILNYYTESEQLKNCLEKHRNKLLELSNNVNYEHVIDGYVCNIGEYKFNIKIDVQN